jgi:8-oxo-dGTP pyrophosphatase MutT (NUDIX family)
MNRREDAVGPAPWPLVKSEPGPDLMIARVRIDTLTNPRTGQDLRRLVLETRDWVNVVALTRERRLVVVRQFRFGAAAVTTEIPGGVVDRGEDHRAAAERELVEESGHTAPRWTYLGCVEPNPAFHNNLCHHWLAEDAERTRELELDPGEDIRAGTLPLEEVVRAVRAGAIRHSLVLSALSRILDLRVEPRLPSG